MAYINQISLDDTSYLIQPLLFATAGGTRVALTANIANFTLVSGTYVSVLVGDVSANATLNVNDTGAKAIFYNNAAISSDVLTANHIYTFIYDGNHWIVMGDLTQKNILIGTTAEWATRINFQTPAGTILIYTDHGTYDDNGTTITVPGIKISDGSAYANSLPFVGDDVAAAIRNELNAHINDNIRHITSSERTFWNNKLNCTIVNENLQLNRL